MKVGALVAKRQRWQPKSHFFGIVVSKSERDEELLVVLWVQDGMYKLQEHLPDALIDLDEYSDEVLKSRTCISV